MSLSVIDGIHGFDDCLAFGDYWGNPNREEVCINVLCKGQKEWCRAVILPAGSACHIHAIVPDKGRDRVLVLTGDADEESAIIEFKSNFNECRILLSGRQQFRSCVAVPWKDGILFATDSPLERNGLYYLADSELQLITSLRGSCIYYDELPDGGMVFSTTVEPDSNLTGWKYIVSRKPGPGITGNQVDLCMVGKQGFNVLESFEKDAWPSLLFQFGAIEPVIGSRHIFLNFTALKNHDRSVMAVDLPGSEIRMHNEGLK
ncbi:MAG: hypothetical protein IJ111_09140 [Eggerthellaceae bacterium]|nr:hypothetical protein [Eggerthellaceae bacterium]